MSRESQRTESESGLKFRVMTYNIRHGLGNPNTDGRPGLVDLDRIARIVGGQDPDVVALQEVDRYWERSGYADQVETLATLLKMHAKFVPNLVLDSSDGRQNRPEYGVLTLSKIEPVAFHHGRFPTVDGFEPRGFGEVVLAIPEVGEIRFFNTHLEVGRSDAVAESTQQRCNQAAIIAARIRVGVSPAIVMGDFNSDPDGPELTGLVGEGTRLFDAHSSVASRVDGFTFPASPIVEPSRRIDFVLVDDRVQVEHSSVVVSPDSRMASDHFPDVVDLRLPATHPPFG